MVINTVRLAVIGMFIILAPYAQANGDPVISFSSINRVGNPEPLTINEIRIVREYIHITHNDGYNCFDVTYILKNVSEKDFPEIHYGFPIDYLVEDELEVYKLTSSYYSESVYEVGWNKLLIKDIQFSFNGKVLPFHSSKESVREAGYEVEVYDNECDSIPIDGINRRWFYTLFSMTPHEESTLNVKYKVYANTSAGIYSDGYDFSYYSRREESAYEGSFVVNSPFTSRYFTQNFRILYDFTPAKHFGKGRNYVIKIDIDLNNLEDANMRGENGYYYDINGIHKDIYVSNPDKIDPINIKIWYSMKNNEDRINTIIERYKIPESEFVTTLNKNNLEIDFKSPRFVSDIACDVDTISVKDIKAEVVFSDGSNKYYIYKPQDIYNRVDTRLKSPLFLTITDLYNDGTGSAEISENLYQNWFFSQDKDFDTPRLKVQKIKFSFDPKLDASAVCKNIKVLDARFIRSEN